MSYQMFVDNYDKSSRLKDANQIKENTQKQLNLIKTINMEFKTGASISTKTRDVNEFIDTTGNIFAVSVLAKRTTKSTENEGGAIEADEFALNHDQLDEVFENAEQIAVSKY